MNSVEELINEVISGVKDEWPTIVKIRYVYLSLGQYLKKNTEFFWAIFNKPDTEHINFKDLKEIYEDDKSKDEKNWDKVICRSASIILKKCYDKLGIESKLVKASNYVEVINSEKKFDEEDSFLVHHWLLAVKDNTNTYFLSLSADLPYIQNGLKTRHFATNIPYYRIDKFGNKVQTYEGEAINHSLLSDEEIRKIDSYLEYLNSYYQYGPTGNPKKEYTLQYDDVAFYIIKQYLRKNEWYYSIIEEENDIYNELMEFVGVNDRHINFNEDNFSSISNEDFNIWIKKLCNLVLLKILKMTSFDLKFDVKDPINNYEEWLNDLSNVIKNYFNVKYSDCPNNIKEILINFNNDSFNTWYRKVKKILPDSQLEEFNNPIFLLSKVNSIISLVRNRKFEKNNFSLLLHQIVFHFINPTAIFKEDGYISNSYIALKFKTMFSKVFNCGTVEKFNKLGYSEQVPVMEEIISNIFQELNFNNCNFKGYDERYSPILNRIQYYPLKSKEDGSYFIMFNIIGKESDTEYFFLYDINNNIIKPVDILDIISVKSKFLIISNRFNTKIANLENVEGKKINH